MPGLVLQTKKRKGRLLCPRCNSEMEREQAPEVAKGREIPVTLYRCHECDADYIKRGWEKLRALDMARPEPYFTYFG